MAARLTIGLMLDIAGIGRDCTTLLDSLLVTAVVDANLGPAFRDPALHSAYASLDRTPPESLRRPISINALAQSLGLPFETVRRHIRKLAAKGVCVVGAHGVHVPAEVLAAPRFIAIKKARYERVMRFQQDLQAAGAVEPLAFPLPPADDPRAPVRAVGRILTDFFFRTLEELHGLVRDPLTGMVLLQILQISAEHIPPAQLAMILKLGGVPETARAPVRASQVAQRLHAPYETTRRHISWLIEDGLVRRADGGVLVDQAKLESPSLQALRQANLVNVRRLSRHMALLGADLAAPTRHAVET